MGSSYSAMCEFKKEGKISDVKKGCVHDCVSTCDILKSILSSVREVMRTKDNRM